MIKHGASILALSAAFGLCGAVMAGQDLLWEIEQPPATFVGTDYSMVYDSSTGSYNAEVADDFDATGLIQEIAVPVIAHRIMLDPQARFSGRDTAQVVNHVLETVPVPI